MASADVLLIWSEKIISTLDIWLSKGMVVRQRANASQNHYLHRSSEANSRPRRF